MKSVFSHLRLVGWDEKINFNVGVYPCSFSLSCQMVSGPFWLKIFPPAVQILVVATRAWEHGSMGSTSSTRRSPWMGRQRSWRSRSMDWRKIRRWRRGVWSSQSIWSSAPQVPHHGRHYWWQRLVIHHDGGQERRSSSLSLPSLSRLWNHGELSIQHQRAHRARSSDAPQFGVPSFALCELYTLDGIKAVLAVSIDSTTGSICGGWDPPTARALAHPALQPFSWPMLGRLVLPTQIWRSTTAMKSSSTGCSEDTGPTLISQCSSSSWTRSWFVTFTEANPASQQWWRSSLDGEWRSCHSNVEVAPMQWVRKARS